MILDALSGYYRRKASGDESALAPEGFEKKEIPFVIVLDEEGRFVQLDDTRQPEGKRLRARSFFVPQGGKRSGQKSCETAYLLWDHAGYVLGVAAKGKKQSWADRQHAAFLALLRSTFGPEPEDQAVRAVLAYLLRGDFAAVTGHPEFVKEAERALPNMSFRLLGETCLVSDRPGVRGALAAGSAPDGDVLGICLVSGEEEAIERLHASIKGVRGAQVSGANIVSFNLDAFNSYGKEQGYNAPVGRTTAFAYTTALNHLLGRDSRQKLQVGDATAVFWADKASGLEEAMLFYFDAPPDDPDDNRTLAVRALFKAPETGRPAFEGDDGTKFFVLGLAPNASRLAVRFWQADTVAGMADKIRRYFQDIRIVHAPHDADYPTLFRLLVAVAALGKADNIPPRLGGDVMRSILSGAPYPQTWLSLAVLRCRAEQSVTYHRAAVIKACLVRANRIDKEAAVSLDEENTNPGYRLGRLFAVLEKTQEEANPGINATIRDRYFGAASATPVSVFPVLLRLNNHHMGKLENKGRVVNLERMIQGIVDAVNGFPAHLNLQDQGLFFLGYYHQRQALFTKTKSGDAEQ